MGSVTGYVFGNGIGSGSESEIGNGIESVTGCVFGIGACRVDGLDEAAE